MIDAEGREWLPDFWGELKEVSGRCAGCNAPCIGGSLTHAKGCNKTGCGAWHHDARAAQDEAIGRDQKQIEARVREYGSNTAPPPGYVPTKRNPTPIGF